ncbi:uncharacterized protein VTP21DRAFT_8161 [Calcarisporiella thermophila]|uniref:uncharacterized protein n=1 Tax=Calcarisporiella thermophila TaxID=911321 RepID=UPI0037437FB5
METAGFVFSAISMVTLWNNCVQAFDIIVQSRHYGMDYEIARVKLEVERTRLLTWGETVGLSNVQLGQPDPDLVIDSRLNRPEMWHTVMQLLGCIQHVFNDTNLLQKKYGLKQEPTSNIYDPSLPEKTRHLLAEDRSQFILESVFKRAYASLQKSAKEYQQTTSMRRKAAWAINDRAKFLSLIAEIRGFNDSLVSLFPDLKSRTAIRLREDIEASEEIRSLQLLQQASADDYEDLSDAASVRLINLGATAYALDHEKTEEVTVTPAPVKSAIQSQDQAGHGTADDADDPEMNELEKALERLEIFVDDKSKGALDCQLLTHDWSSHCSAWIYWKGDQSDFNFRWRDKYMGFVKLPHNALDIYHRKKFIKKARYDKYNSLTDEDYVFIDIESDPNYDNINPGTVTIQGFGLECWDYEEHFGKQYEKTILVNYADIPSIPAKKLLRRLHELRVGAGTLGWNSKRDYEDLKEFTGNMGVTYTKTEYAYDHMNQISGLYSLLNRQDVFVNFGQVSSVALAAYSENNFWNFLWQMILGKELARRLNQFPDASISGFTPKVLTTLIAADCWLNNVEIVLEDLKESEDEKAEGKGKGKEAEETKDEESNPRDDAYDITEKSIQLHSHVHEKQVEGLLRFAEILKWPYMNETRDYAEDIYSNLRSGSTINLNLWDWLFGTVLPGKWAAHKIMTALVLCTPSLVKDLRIAKYFDNGLSLPNQSYWRSRTVLGRVLGCLPGVKMLCGWVGPCPPIEGPRTQFIRLKTRRVAPLKRDRNSSNVIHIGGKYSDDGDETIRPKPDEDIYQWMSEVKDQLNWVIPEPPVRQMTTCSLESIRVKELPLDVSLSANASTMSKAEIEDETEYRATVVFKIDNEPSIAYTLYTNPVFVTVPACNGPEGKHQVHTRELPKFHRNIWNVEDLKNASADEYDNNGVLVINATGKGAEAVARAWCSERGKNAVIRRNPGPCYTCAYNVASEKGLGINVLIWVS